jgi:hypothetical protein
MEREPGLEEPVWRGRVGGILGLASLTLLLASFRWAHHWGPVADTIVGGWALATIGALLVSIWSLRTSRASQRFANAGIALTIPSYLAVTLVSVLSAAGVDAADQCGGG